MRTFLTLLALVTSANAITVAGAAEPAMPTGGLAKVAPYVDDSTRVVISVDLSRIDVSVMLRMLVPSLPDGTSVGADLQRLRTTLLAAKIKDVYVLVSLAELPQQPWFLLAPCPPDLEPAALFAQLHRKWPVWLGRAEAQTVRRIDRDDTGPMLFIGLEETLKRLTHAPFPSRPELAASWRAVEGAPIRILFLPTDDDRRVVEELFPTLPERFGSGPSTVLTRGLRWASCGIDVTPKRSIQLIAESADPPAAEALQLHWTKLLAGLVLPSGQSRVASQPTGSQFAGQIERLVPDVNGQRLVLTLDQPGKGLAALEDFLATRPVAQMVIGHYVTQQLQQLAFAMHNWHDTNKQFPAQANYDGSDRPLLSWRVHLLPFLGDEATTLYRRFRLDEPWDSEHNRSLIPEMPQVYALPGSQVAREGRTCYVRPVGESTSCPARQPIAFRDITDGTSATVMIVEVDDKHAVVWTKPEDWTFDRADPAKGLGGHVPGSSWSVFCDGAPHVLEETFVDPKQLKAAFTRNGGEPLEFRRRIQGLSQ